VRAAHRPQIHSLFAATAFSTWGRCKRYLVDRFGQDFKDHTVARLLPPENASLEQVSREVGVSIHTLERWRRLALAEQTRQDKRRIAELERELRRKDKALAEAAALLVLSKKVEAIFTKGEAS
jgi:hypothetical protein